MWRVKYGRGNAGGTGSAGDWVYYEAHHYTQMEQDILEAMLNGDCGDGRRHSGGNPLSRVFRRYRNPELDDDGGTWRRYQVIEVAYLDGDDWVPVEFSFTPPQVIIGSER